MSADPCVPIVHTLTNGGALRFAPHRLVGRIRSRRHHAKAGQTVLHGMKGCGKHLTPDGTGLAARPTDVALAPVAKLGGGKLAASLAGAALAALVGAHSLDPGATAHPGDPGVHSGLTIPPGAGPAGFTRPGAPGVGPGVTEVPEPSSLLLLLGAGSFGLVLRRFWRGERITVRVDPRPWRLPGRS